MGEYEGKCHPSRLKSTVCVGQFALYRCLMSPNRPQLVVEGELTRAEDLFQPVFFVSVSYQVLNYSRPARFFEWALGSPFPSLSDSNVAIPELARQLVENLFFFHTAQPESSSPARQLPGVLLYLNTTSNSLSIYSDACTRSAVRNLCCAI